MAGSAELHPHRRGQAKLLLLAAEDMRQAAEGARLVKRLRAEAGHSPSQQEVARIHVLETGIVIAYMRPFSWSKHFTPLSKKDVPAEWHTLHGKLRNLRDKVYAHIDEHPARDASVGWNWDSSEGGPSGYQFEVHTVGLSPDDLEGIITLCDEQAAKLSSIPRIREAIYAELPVDAPGSDG